MEFFQTEGSGKQLLEPGIYEANIVDINDITDRVRAWAQLAVEITFKTKESDLELKSTIFINFERDDNGSLDAKKNTWSIQFNNLLRALDYNGGFSRSGNFITEAGDKSSDIVYELVQKMITIQEDCPFVISIYRDKKGYLAVDKRIFKKHERELLEKYVANKAKKAVDSGSKPAGIPTL